MHPGYGFLAEDAGFARAVLDAGLVWVGPPPDAIAAMGSKVDAKELVAAAGVPVLPSLDPASAGRTRRFPLLVKASYGGGGRGMRVVRATGRRWPTRWRRRGARRRPRSATARSSSSAGWSAPGTSRCRCSADSHGTVWALGERDCSVQRRHQKVVEEAPAPARTRAARRLFEAAVAAARSVGYVGAGTVEFLVDAGRRGRTSWR